MSPKEIHDDFIKTFGDGSPSYSTVKKWASEFKRRRRAWRIMIGLGVELVHSLIMYDRRINLHDIAGQIGISVGAVQSIFINLRDFQCLSYRMLTKDQKKSRLDISKYVLSLFLSREGDGCLLGKPSGRYRGGFS